MSRNYKPRRQTARWLDGDCPKGVLAIFDAGPEWGDRYTVFYTEPVVNPRNSMHGMVIGFRGMSENPFHPQGVGMYGELEAWQLVIFRQRASKQKCRWTDLPDKVKACVRQDLGEE